MSHRVDNCGSCGCSYEVCLDMRVVSGRPCCSKCEPFHNGETFSKIASAPLNSTVLGPIAPAALSPEERAERALSGDVSGWNRNIEYARGFKAGFLAALLGKTDRRVLLALDREWGCGDPHYHRALDGSWILESRGTVGRGTTQDAARSDYMRQWNERGRKP